MIADTTLALLRDLARRPGHDEVKAGFRQLLHSEFDVPLADLDFEVRQPVIRGRIDALVGRTVFEAKRDLAREIGDVERRMPDYLADRERIDGEKYVGLASDGLKWIAYELDDGALIMLTQATLDAAQPERFLTWLDGVVALKASLPPTPMSVRAELGQDGAAFQVARRAMARLWDGLKADPAQALKRQLWADLLAQVYGREVDADALWFQHSYLVIVAKCIAVSVLGLSEDDPAKLLSGEAFVAAGIQGAAESDFFDWVVAIPEGAALVGRIMGHVRRFRLREVESDVLKVLYESLIDRDQRHGLGEYYTPDWLAAKVVKHVVDRPLEQKVLDPACGSGTFLFHAVRLALADADAGGMPPERQAAEVAALVAGVDIHPVAVIIARVTYLLALAPALANRSGRVTIPVYLGDTMQLGVARTFTETELVIRVPPPPAGAEPLQGSAGREILSFPDTFCRDSPLFDKAIERMRTGTLVNLTRAQIEAALIQITREHYKAELDEEQFRAVRDLGTTYETFDRLRREGRDTIWAYVARNLSRPLALSAARGWANVLVGNPPWVAYRHMSDALQKSFKELAKAEKVYVGGKFATQNDLCALFTARASHLYLRPGGRLAFVLPLTALTRGQFEGLRSGRFGHFHVSWDEAWTMDDRVVPLFPVPSCAVFGRKRAVASKMPETVRAYSGTLPLRDAAEHVAVALLKVDEGAAAPTVGVFAGGSPFRSMFRQGATLSPRMLCFVERKSSGRLGSNLSAPLVRSRRNTQEKEPWKLLDGVELSVEADFLRPVLLGESVLPFRTWNAAEGVIPVNEAGRTLDAVAALACGADGLAGWMRSAEKIWSDNAKNEALTLIQRWDFQRGLSNQFPIRSLRMVYATSGSLPSASIVRDTKAVIDTGLYWTEPESEEEAYFLSAIVNSETTRALSAKYQARGQFGARHFHKVIFNLPIPRFDERLAGHMALADAAREAETLAATVALPEGVKFQRARAMVRAALTEAGIAGLIETLVGRLLR